MDVRLPDGSGVEACREIRSELPDSHMIMLTSYADEEAIMPSIYGRRFGLPAEANAWLSSWLRR